MELKKVFEGAENGALTYEQFEARAKELGAKFADLSEGAYVSTGKYNDGLASKTKEIETLNETIAARDKDLAALQEQLKNAGEDSAKLAELSQNLTDLQSKYDGDTKAYKDRLKKQAYEFAVKEFTNAQKFTSSAAKRDFERALLDKDLKMDKDKILGADDFVTAYKADNEDAFFKEESKDTGTQGADNSVQQTPHFVSPAQQDANNDPNTGGFKFNFTGVRPVPTN